MAHALTLTCGSTTISLSDGTGVILNAYAPVGATIKEGVYAPVTETIEVTVTGASVAAALTKVNEIDGMLNAARERQNTRRGLRVYLNYAPASQPSYRSEVFDGQFTPAAKSISQGVGQRLLGYRLHLTRSPFWEGASTQIPLTNANGTNNTAGLTVWNHDDSDVGHDNYVQIASTDVAGSVPAPVELRLSNADGATRYYRNFYVANNRWGTGLAHIIQGETAIGGYGTPTSNGAASGGQYASLSGSGWLTFRWLVPSASLEIIRGRYVRILAKFFAFPSGAREIQARVYDWDGLIARTPVQSTWSNASGATFYQDCGAVQLPPIETGDGVEAWKDVTLEIKIKTSGTETFGIDYLVLMPAEDGCYRHFVQQGFGIDATETIYDGGSPVQTYANDGSNRYDIFSSMTPPLLVWPREAQRFYLAWDGTGGAISWQLSAKAFYRPRKLSF
jgi:hypothetical protein